MAEVKERISTLEKVLSEFIVQTDKSLNRMEEDTAAFKEEIRVFREEVRQDQQLRDADTKAFREELRKDQQLRDADMKVFREEVRQDQQQRDADMKAFQKEVNKKWGDLANRLGTVVEDIVAPNLRTIAQQYFGCTEINSFAPNIERRSQLTSKLVEFDVILVCQKYLFVNQTKSKPEPKDVKDFIEKQLEKIFEYFPEYEGKTVIPTFASLSLPENVVKQLTRKKIYAMTAKGDTMDLVNYEEVQKRS